jgi:hypothetical protein
MRTWISAAVTGGATIVFALCAAVPASATPRLGSASFQSVRTCSGLPDDVDCLGPQNPDLTRKETYIFGGEFVDIDSEIFPLPENGGGRIVSRVQSGELDLPVIKSAAFAGDDNRLGSTIVTYGGFTFTGNDPLPYALDVLMDWTGSGAPRGLEDIANGMNPPGEYGGEGYGGLQLWLFDAAFVPAFPDAPSIIQFPVAKSCGSDGVLGYSFGSLHVSEAGFSEATFSLTDGCDSNPLLLQPDASYVLFAQMQTIANRYGSLDASNTVRVVLSETLPEEVRTQLVEQIVTDRSQVPEPGTWALMSIAGLGLVGARLRRRRATAIG